MSERNDRNPTLKKRGLKRLLMRMQDYFALKAETVFSVNRTLPRNGDVTIRTVPFSDNLTSEKTQASEGEFLIRTAGGDASISDGGAYAIRIMGNRAHTGYVAEQLEMSVIPMERPEGETPITAAIDRDTFVAYVDESGTITLVYTTAWNADPEDYGITVEGDPVAGDQIVVVYVKEDRGTITQASPAALKSTGWNLYNHTAGYAYVRKYSEQYGFRIGGTYTALAWAETPEGEAQAITPVDGAFTVPGDGYVIVTGGNGTDTYIINVWSDWTEGPVGTFEAYSESGVDLSSVMSANFPNGLMRVGDVRDEIDLNSAQAISRIGRMAYSEANLASAKASGRPWEADSDYIYIVKAEETVAAITLDGSYVASDHGNEFFTGTAVAVYLETIYGNNLKNKLERDVLTISQQTLTSAQKTQVRNNIGAASAADLGSKSSASGVTGDDAFSKIASLNSKFRQISSGSFHDIKEPGIYWLTSGVTDKPNNGAGTYIINKYSNDYLSGLYIVADDSKLYSVKYSGGVWKYTPISDIINTKVEYTTAFDVSVSATGSHFYCDRIGRTVFFSLVINSSQNLPANTQIAHVNGISNILEAYASSIGSNGTGGRFKINSNGSLIIERAIPANEWFSATFVAEYNVTL